MIGPHVGERERRKPLSLVRESLPPPMTPPSTVRYALWCVVCDRRRFHLDLGHCTRTRLHSQAARAGRLLLLHGDRDALGLCCLRGGPSELVRFMTPTVRATDADLDSATTPAAGPIPGGKP